ncbi:hypothetical protein B0T14DRAFT_479830 [Immersiella caudata]|uniref:Uncharacterized protein n=1 Tax=Immersiella caudata TaxID=314043 RepID=A0AA39WQ74_9PEZI|nr:hypothetical protein B0T14DRAFT_479830 [Immersiella caudata]
MDQSAMSKLIRDAVLAPQRNDAIEKVVRQLSEQATASAAETGKLSDFIWDVFNAVFDVSATIGTPAQKLLPVFMEKLRQANVAGADDKTLKHEGGEVWKDLPTFGWVARDHWNFDAWAPMSGDEYTEIFRRSAFLASLTFQSSDLNDLMDPFNFSMFGLWALRTAFEDTLPHDVTNTQAAELAVPWIACSGESLLKLSQENANLPANVGAGGERFRSKGWKGFNPERWAVWRDGFAAAAERAEDTKDILQSVVKIFDELQRTGKQPNNW